LLMNGLCVAGRMGGAVMATDTTIPESMEGSGGFLTGSTVDVRQLDDKFWVTLQPLVYQGKTQRFVIPKGHRTDFASVPRPFVWFLPRYGRYTPAAVLHDYLWSDAVPAGQLTRADADGIFRRAMRELKVPFLRRWIMWAAVRWGALPKADGRRGWLNDSWRVLIFTVVAVPIVAPAAAVILLTLPVFALAELLVWLPLLANQRLRARRGQPAKQVNPPSLRLKT
jgi:Protein of unknown function (DUF1353)